MMTEYTGASVSSFSDWSCWSWRWHESWKTHALITSRWRWLPIASQIRDRVSFSKYQVASEYFLFLIHSLPLWYPHFSQHYLVLPLGSKCPHLPDDPPVCHLPSSAPSILNFIKAPFKVFSIPNKPHLSSFSYQCYLSVPSSFPWLFFGLSPSSTGLALTVWPNIPIIAG